MSDSSGQKPPQNAAPPVPAAVSRQAPGVRSARQAPAGGVTLHTGDVIGGKFIVGRYLGASTGTISYLCKDQKRDRDAVIKVIDLGIMPAPLQKQLSDEVVKSAQLVDRNLTGLYGMGKVDGGHLFVAMEFVQGLSLARMIAQRREARKRLELRDVFTVIAHLTLALEKIHAGGLVHGVVTPYNISISRRGVLKLSNLAFGRATAEALLAREEGPFSDSIYVAPELTKLPTQSSPASDVYSVAMLAVELLAEDGLPADRQAAKSAVSRALNGYPPKLTQLLLRSLDSDPAQRPSSLAELRETLEEVARERGFKLGQPPAEGELPIEPAVEPEREEGASEAEDDDLFNIPGLAPGGGGEFGGAEIFGADEAEDEGRYLVQKDGLDYGPFTEDEVLEQLHSDEIDEDTLVLDRLTQERVRLEDLDAFSAAVAEYIPIREERRRAEAARRAELQRKVKKGGVTVFVVGIIAGLFVLAGMLYVVFTQPDPKPLPMDRAFASLDFKLLPPPKEFTTVAVDKSVMQSIFNPEASEEEIQRQINKLRKKRKKRGPRGKKKAGAPGDENVSVVDMSSSGSKKVLSDAEVNEVILGKWGSLRRCVMKEFQTNPNFKGVTVQFFIRPSGTTGGVKVKEKQYADKSVGRCLVSRFRAMKFPEHGGFNKGVVFPLRVQ